jgi:crotonobetaine/carnitine-CoA ligase
MYSHANLFMSALTTNNAFQWRPDDRLLHYFPLHHANGGMVQMGPTLLKGSAFVMVPKFSASDFGGMLSRHRITMAAVNATHVKMVMAHPVTPADSDHPCRRMLFGLSLDRAGMQAFEERFKTRLVGTYGLTESLAFVVAGTLEGPEPEGSAGRVCNGYELIVVDDEDTELPVGRPGEVLIRYVNDDGVCRGYWRDPEATEKLFKGGWLHSGDVASFDELGWLHFVQRKKDMIKRSGFNVAPAEVERVLLGHPSVRDAAVVGIPDEFREEAIVGFVTISAEVAAEELVALCGEQLANYKVPETVFAMEKLPEDVLGKIDRKQLRQIAIERLRPAVAKA